MEWHVETSWLDFAGDGASVIEIVSVPLNPEFDQSNPGFGTLAPRKMHGICAVGNHGAIPTSAGAVASTVLDH